MQEKPKVSVCIPTYNAEKYISKTIDSILNQTFRDFELIVVDNCSEDSTIDILSKYKDQRIKIIRNEKNLGACGNWNKCLELASGDYIALYHADDIYEDDILRKEVEVLDNHSEVGAVFTEANIIDDDGNLAGSLTPPPHMKGKLLFTFADIFLQLLRNIDDPLVCPTCMARKSLYQKIAPYNCTDFRWVFDIDMYLRMAEKMKIAIIAERLINYRRYAQQGSAKYAMGDTDHDEFFDMLDSFVERNVGLLNKSDLERYECHKQWDCTVHAIKALYRKDQSLALKLLKKSISSRRLFTSLTDLRLLVRFVTSVILLLFTYIGFGTSVAKIALRYRMRAF